MSLQYKSDGIFHHVNVFDLNGKEILVFNVAHFQQPLNKWPILTSQLAAGPVVESLGMDDWTAVD